MASTITPATLTVTITEAITLGGSDRGSTHTRTVASVATVDPRIMNVGTAEVDILGFGSATGQGQYVRTDLRYLRVTNKDDTNFVTLGVSKTGADTAFFKLGAGQTFMMSNDELEVDATGSASSAFVEIDSISAKADTAACDLEIFVALV